jgi:hypothetical protein
VIDMMLAMVMINELVWIKNVAFICFKALLSLQKLKKTARHFVTIYQELPTRPVSGAAL